MKFSELDLNPLILKAVKEMGYSELTPIQIKAFPIILQGRDLLATAETGSGKTSACGVPLAQRCDPTLPAIQALVLVPTRELALQYVEEIGRIAQFLRVVPFAVYGGFDMDVQKAKLQAGVHILVATPGRLIDLLYGGHLTLTGVRTLVLDEADEMLKLGFLEDIDFIFSCLVHEHQTLLFSATMPAEVKRLAETYLKNPEFIELNVEQRAPQSLEHHFQYINPKARIQTLIDYLRRENVSQAILFCNSRLNAEKLFQNLKGKLPAVEVIHGGLEQSRRSSTIRRFRNRQIIHMVATDLAGRGLDFMRVSHIINFDFPHNPEVYTHRTGRTARMGRTGVALTFVSRHNLGPLKRVIRINRIQPFWPAEAPPEFQAGGGPSEQASPSPTPGKPRAVKPGFRQPRLNRQRRGFAAKKRAI